jgi:predicted metalloprotease
MNNLISRTIRLGGFALLFASAATLSAATVPAGPSVDVTAADVNASNAKVGQAYGALVDMWSKDFDAIGERFAAPRIVRYHGNVMTNCGVMPANNALYCAQRNTIFFDEIFVARMAKTAAANLGTDGDMAAVGIIAHEMGHAVAAQLGAMSRIPYENEATADCLAGAFTQHAAKDGSLEKGDLEEAFFGMASAGDPTPEYTGNNRVDRRIALRAQYLGHGTREQRQASFKAGYDGGAKACIEGLQ